MITSNKIPIIDKMVANPSNDIDNDIIDSIINDEKLLAIGNLDKDDLQDWIGNEDNDTDYSDEEYNY